MTPVINSPPSINESEPPICSAMPMASGAVTDFGANEARTTGDAPISQAISTAYSAANAAASGKEARIGFHRLKICWRC